MEQIVDRKKLLAKLVETGTSRFQLCNILGLTYQGFNNKIRGRSVFTENEIYKLVSLFGKDIIFLPTTATKNATK